MESYRPHAAAGYGQPQVARPQQSQGLKWSRISLRVVSLLCGAASIGFSVYYYNHYTIGLLLMMGPPAAVSTLWSLIDILFLSIRNGIHPAGCLIIDLLLFIALAAISGALAFMLSKLSDSGWGFAFFPPNDLGSEYIRIVLGFGIVGALVHLVAILLAVYEFKLLRRAAKRSVYMPGSDDGSFPDRNVGEAPPAYSGPSQSYKYQPQDQISIAQQTYELPAKKPGK